MAEPLGVTVRPATLDDVPEMSRVFVDTFRAAHRGQLPEALLLERTYESSARGWARALREITTSDHPDEHVLVATDGAGRLAGLAMGGPPRPWPRDEEMRLRRPTGECYALYVDGPSQGRGVGGALLSELRATLASAEVRRMLVGVLAVNEPARRFYESAGGVLLGERQFDDSGVLLDEVVYVYDDSTADPD